DGQLGGEPRQQVDGAPGCGRRQALPAEGATGRRQAGRTRQAARGAATLGLLQRRPARSGADLATGLPDHVPLPAVANTSRSTEGVSCCRATLRFRGRRRLWPLYSPRNWLQPPTSPTSSSSWATTSAGCSRASTIAA